MLCHFGAGKVTTCASQCPLTPLAGPNRAPKVPWGRRRARGRIGPFPSTHHARLHPKPPPSERGSCAGITPARLALSCFLPENPPARLCFQRFPTQGSALNPAPLRLGGGAGTLLQSRAVLGATAALTDFCPFKSLLAFFSPFPTHPWSIPGASRHPPLPLPWQPPPQHPLQQLPPLKFPLKASAGEDCGVPTVVGGSLGSSGPRESGCPHGVGSQQYPTPAPALGLCRLLGNGSFLELAGNWEEEGKEPSGTTSRQCHQRGRSPVLEPAQGMPTWLLHPDEAKLPGVGFGHRGHRTQPSCSQGSWGTSRVGVPPSHQPPAPILALRV